MKKSAGEMSSLIDHKGRTNDEVTSRRLYGHTYIWLNKSVEFKESLTFPTKTSRWW